MKKIACTLAVIVAVLSLTGCPAIKTEETVDVSGEADTNVTETTDAPDKSTVEGAAAGSAASTGGADASVNDTVSAETAEIEEFIPVVDESHVYRNGTWYFTSNDSNGVEKHYLYITDTKELISFEPEDKVADVSGYLVAYNNGTIKNIKTNEVYCNPDEGMGFIKTSGGFIKGHRTIFADDGTALITKTVADFDSNSTYFGILNSDGTWRNELNADYELATLDGNTELKYLGNGYVKYGKDNNGNDSEGYFCIDNQTLFDYEVIGGTFNCPPEYVYSNDSTAYFIDWSVIYNSIGLCDVEGFTAYEKGTNTATLIEESGSKVCYYTPSGRYIVVSHTGDTNIAYDMETNERIVFDVSGYEIFLDKYENPAFSVVGHTYLFECVGADGNNYICAINTAGERVIEPKVMEYQRTIGDKYLCTVDGVLTMFNSVTGAETALQGELVNSYLHAYGDGSVIVISTDEGCKLLDMDNPDVPYSPFDKG